MYYMYQVRPQAAPLASLRTTSLPQTARILGLPAESFIRIVAPLVTGGISTVGLIYSIQGRHTAATAVALTGVLMSSFVAMAQAVAVEEERVRT
jgi:hypothetical protein